MRLISSVILVTAAYQLSGCKKVDQNAVKKQINEMKDNVNLLKESEQAEFKKLQEKKGAYTSSDKKKLDTLQKKIRAAISASATPADQSGEDTSVESGSGAETTSDEKDVTVSKHDTAVKEMKEDSDSLLKFLKGQEQPKQDLIANRKELDEIEKAIKSTDKTSSLKDITARLATVHEWIAAHKAEYENPTEITTRVDGVTLNWSARVHDRLDEIQAELGKFTGLGAGSDDLFAQGQSILDRAKSLHSHISGDIGKMAKFDSDTVFAVELMGHSIKKTSKGFEIEKKVAEKVSNEAALGLAAAGSEIEKKLQAKRIQLHRDEEKLREELEAIQTAERHTVQAHFEELREKEKFTSFNQNRKDNESWWSRRRGLEAILRSVPDSSIDAKFVISVGSQVTPLSDATILNAFAAKIGILLTTDAALNKVGSDELDQIEKVCQKLSTYRDGTGAALFDNLIHGFGGIDEIKAARTDVITAQKSRLEAAWKAMDGKKAGTDEATVMGPIKDFIAAGKVPEWTSPASLKTEMEGLAAKVASTAFARLKVEWLTQETQRISSSVYSADMEEDLQFVDFIGAFSSEGDRANGLAKLRGALESKILAEHGSKVTETDIAAFAEVAQELEALRPKKDSIAEFDTVEQILVTNVEEIVLQLEERAKDPTPLNKALRAELIAQIDEISKFIGVAGDKISTKPGLMKSLTEAKTALAI